MVCRETLGATNNNRYFAQCYIDFLYILLVVTLYLEPPRFVNKTKDQELNTDSTLSLTCVFSGVPLPTITWFHHAYGGNGRRGELVILISETARQVTCMFEQVSSLF